MADNVAVTAGSGTTIAADEVVDGTLGTVKVQYVKIMDATLDGTTKAAVGANGLKVDASGAAVPITDNSGSITVDNAGTFAVQVSSISAGTNAIGKLAANSGVDIGDVDVTTLGGQSPAYGAGATGATVLRTTLATDSAGIINVGTAGSAASNVVTVQGIASMTPVATTQGVTATANGATASRIKAAASTNATNLKASAGQIYTIDVFNAAAYNVFLKIYNKASSPTVGTDTPVITIPVQAGGGYSKTWSMGFPLGTGVSYAITKLQADSDTTVVVADDLTGNIIWI